MRAAILVAVACNGRIDFESDRGPTADGGRDVSVDGVLADTSANDAKMDGALSDARGPSACVGDRDCVLASLHCLAAPGQLGACVECADDSQCASATRPHCDPGLHRCVECVLASHCPTASSFPSNCTAVSRRCQTGCSDDSPTSMLCPASRRYTCNDDLYLCVECLTNADCVSASTGPICHPSEYVCVQCLSTTCAAGLICDALTGRCVQCRTSTDCPAATPLCDPATGACVGVQ